MTAISGSNFHFLPMYFFFFKILFQIARMAIVLVCLLLCVAPAASFSPSSSSLLSVRGKQSGLLVRSPRFFAVSNTSSPIAEQLVEPPTGIDDLRKVPSDSESEKSWSDVMPKLLATCRLSNIPGAVFMALCGAYRAASFAPSSLSSGVAVSSRNSPKLASFFKTDVLNSYFANILVCVSLVAMTSMVVNDYFDARSGTDLVNVSLQGEDESYMLDKPMADGTLPLPYAKKFVSMLYSLMLILVCFLSQTGTRLAVIVSSILTFLYTNQIKPFTFWKNVSCATVIAATPLIASISVTRRYAFLSFAQAASFYSRMFPLIGAIFFGVLHREVLMDMQDVEGDRAANVKTIPVVYGARFACSVALGMVTLMLGTSIGEFVRVSRMAHCWKCYVRPALSVAGCSAMFTR